jgi:hypothetical protein
LSVELLKPGVILHINMRRLSIEIVTMGTAIAFALALLMATLGAAAGAVENIQDAQTPASGDRAYEGMVTCSRCEAKHSAALSQPADVCVRVCVHGGAKFALVNADATYLLDGDMAALKKVAGQRARIVGSLSGKTIKVSSVSAQI